MTRHLVPVAGDAARMTNRCGEIRFVITPETLHVLVFHVLDSHIFTDGRDVPTLWTHLSSAFP
jgi:hypothetical protein